MRDLECEAKAQVEDWLLGGDHAAGYSDLDAWTGRARAFSAALLRCASVDDLLIAWAAAVAEALPAAAGPEYGRRLRDRWDY